MKDTETRSRTTTIKKGDEAEGIPSSPSLKCYANPTI